MILSILFLALKLLGGLLMLLAICICAYRQVVSVERGERTVLGALTRIGAMLIVALIVGVISSWDNYARSRLQPTAPPRNLEPTRSEPTAARADTKESLDAKSKRLRDEAESDRAKAKSDYEAVK